jgi:Na+-transporting NADH:ubiquinone oxidoreductase subunit B
MILSLTLEVIKMVAQKKTSGYFQRQPIMRKVLVSLIPVAAVATFLFGLRVLTLTAVVIVAGSITEYIFAKKRKAKISEAVLVSSVLFTLSLPVATPYWIAVIGIVFGVIFAKEVFGGYGRNVFNPAIVGRAFIFISFPEYLTASWNQISTSFPGGFAVYMTPALDTLSQATPIALFNQTGNMVPYSNILIGSTFGSMGETSALVLLLGGIYLVVKKAADWRLMVSPLIGFIGLAGILYLIGIPSVPPPLYGVFTGGFFFLSIYFVTEPTTAPKTVQGKWIYGVSIGMITVIIRYFGIFPEGATFALLIMNTFVPIMDEGVKYMKQRRQVKAT